jgi:hypothetical protein
LVIGFEIGYESFERGGIFTFDKDPAGSEAVFEGVLAGCGFASRRARTAFGLSFGCFIVVGVEGFAHKGFPGTSLAGAIWGGWVILLIPLSECEVTVSALQLETTRSRLTCP